MFDLILKVLHARDDLYRLGTAATYTGAGVMRTPQLNSVTIVRTSKACNRSLRLFRSSTCIRYGRIKQSGLLTAETEKLFQNVLKFADDRLSAVMATFIIKIKPFQIAAAKMVYVSSNAHARAAGSLLVVGPQCLPRTSKHDKVMMLQIINGYIHDYMPAMNVSTLRHAIDAISKRAAELYTAKGNDPDGTIRAAMAHLSAHGESTSDSTYGNDEESIVFKRSGYEVDRYRMCARIFNTFIGLESESKCLDRDEEHDDVAELYKSPALRPPAADGTTPPTVGLSRDSDKSQARTLSCIGYCHVTCPTTGPLANLKDGREDGALLQDLDARDEVDSDGNAHLLAHNTDTSKRGSSSSGAAAMTTFGVNESSAATLDPSDLLFDALNAEIYEERSIKRAKRPHQSRPATQSPFPALRMSPGPRALIARSGAAEQCETLALPTVPRTPLPRAPIAGPAADAPLVTVTDFAFQAEVIRLLTQANRENGDSNTISNSCGRSTPNTCHRRELAGHSANIKR